MSEENRADRFKAEIEEMQLKTASAGGDKVMQGIGLAMMVIGVVAGIVLWSSSTSGTIIDLDQRELVVLGLAMVSVVIMGAALFVVGALRQFLRFWLLRLLYESR